MHAFSRPLVGRSGCGSSCCPAGPTHVQPLLTLLLTLPACLSPRPTPAPPAQAPQGYSQLADFPELSQEAEAMDYELSPAGPGYLAVPGEPCSASSGQQGWAGVPGWQGALAALLCRVFCRACALNHPPLLL